MATTMLDNRAVPPTPLSARRRGFGKIEVWLLVTALAAFFSPTTLRASDQTKTPAEALSRSAEEKEACVKNLKTIYQAVEAYQRDHKALPNWLSDLVPQYLADVDVLICPVCRRTGQTEVPGLADPKLPTSYVFEFCPLPLGAAATNAPTRTRREWKRRQMGLVGAIVPIVRCRHHTPVLNLAFDGSIYESPPAWEQMMTNRVDPADLSPTRMFADEPAPAIKPPAKRAAKPLVPARDPAAPQQLLDLTRFYNAGLTQSWHGSSGNDLGALPRGLQNLAGVEFDLRGIVQLASKSPSSTNYPVEIQGIKVGQKCQRLHFLHAAAFGKREDEGAKVGLYVVRFGSNQMRLQIPIRYGHEVRDWHLQPGEPEPADDLTVAWRGDNAVSRQAGRSIRLFMTTWTNVAPTVEIDSIDFVSAMARPAPFLIGITVD